MPSFSLPSRRVSFSSRNDYSRLPQDDELYVIGAFARHASKCRSCSDPYQTYREGGTLCPKGHQRALDVAQYVYGKAGQAYSVVDSERNQRVQVEIPSECPAVRSLLKAMERGLRIMKRGPTQSFDRSYYVPARRSSDRGPVPAPLSSSSYPSLRRAPSTANLRLETVEPPRSPRPRHSRSRSYSTSKPSAPLVPLSISSAPRTRSASPDQRPGLSRYATSASTSFASRPPSRTASRNNSYSSAASCDNSPFSSRNNSVSSQSSYGSFSRPSSASHSRNNSLSRAYGSGPAAGDRDRDSYDAGASGKYGHSDNRGLALFRRRGSSVSPERGERLDYSASPERGDRRGSARQYKAPVIYRIKREPSPPGLPGGVAAPAVPPKDEYAYRRRR